MHHSYPLILLALSSLNRVYYGMAWSYPQRQQLLLCILLAWFLNRPRQFYFFKEQKGLRIPSPLEIRY